MRDPEETTIGELAEREGLTPRTIRYYVAEGLLPPPRAEGKQWFYGPAHAVRLRLIRRLQAEHLPLKEIRARLGALSLAEMEGLLGAAPRPRGRMSARRLFEAILKPEARTAAAATEAPLLLRQMMPPPPAAPAPSVWRRVTLAPGVELHYQEGDAGRQRLVERLCRAAEASAEEEDPR